MKNPINRALHGLGVHTGIPCSLRMELSEALSDRPIDSAIPSPRFFFPGHSTPLRIPDLLGLPRFAARSTILGTAAASIRTPEHLLAALLFFTDQSIDIHSDASELPGLDGSALGFREALSELAPECAAAPAWREYPTDLDWEHRWDYGHIRVRPAPRFQVRYLLDRPPLRQDFILSDPQSAWDQVLPARTFAFHREWRAALEAGLMAGAGLDSGLLLAETATEHAALLANHPDWLGGPFPLLNQPAWRMEDEPVKHKVLDLLGDLALAGLALPALDIEIRNGGHSINHMLLEKLSLN